MYWSDLSEAQQMALIKVAAIALDNDLDYKITVKEKKKEDE